MTEAASPKKVMNKRKDKQERKASFEDLSVDDQIDKLRKDIGIV